ncbi:hypothetical protein K227x_32810 [Rubripirellula lacrimiformis]|uniref:Uncharacterized protein n=1 Tax=Rubripirellula lacrimiformis TaxID=1930273 RepID=A0A517NCL9_9BACT|nr:hypothetical protein K227x_32810 [Rubripirellula lacrimiformis]
MGFRWNALGSADRDDIDKAKKERCQNVPDDHRISSSMEAGTFTTPSPVPTIPGADQAGPIGHWTPGVTASSLVSVADATWIMPHVKPVPYSQTLLL